ncbi:MAG: lamin tail domain-containing protein [Sedimentisphaerales bacterium]|nr:lamin tail domain-containing protein [Sedimentisphaerales bacterium]
MVFVSATCWCGTVCGAESGTGPGFPVVVNEVMASNTATIRDAQLEYDDWIELYNAGGAPIDLAGLYLTDDLDEPTQWRFPAGNRAATTIAAGGYLIVWADEGAGVGLHASFSLDAQGDDVYLVDADGQTVLDHLAFGKQTSDVSYGRHPDGGAALRFFYEPTPVQANNEGYLGEVEPLHFSHERGFYNTSFALTIACPTAGAEILYTTDGRDPDDESGRFIAGETYTGPLWMGTTACVRAMAVKEGWKPTDIYTHTYIFNAPAHVRSLPVISLVGDERQTFYEPDGVMAIVGGTYSGGVWTSSSVGSYNNVLSRGLERPVSCEWLFPNDPDASFQIDCGLRVHGSDYMRPRYVRQNGQWSGSGKFALRLYFRGEYGASWLEYPLIAESEVERFKTVVLRAGHNDQTNPFIKDELIRRLMKDMGSAAPVGTMANLFINGQYKGYFNPTEHVKEEACQEWFDSDQPWDVMTMSGIRDGNADSWNAMLNYARNNNLALDVHYQEIAKRLDIPQFIDYLIMRLWPNDWDWPQNNWSAAAERSPNGQWKFFVWDAEGTFETNQLNNIRFSELNNQSNANGWLYRALKANATFRQTFGDRLQQHFFNNGALTASNVERRFRELQEELRGVIPNMNTYIVDTWVPSRQSIFLNACISEGLYTFGGPVFALNGFPSKGGYASPGDWLLINPTQVNASVYYTLDGASPGTPGPVGPVTLVNLVTRETPKRVFVPTGPVDDWQYGRGFNDSSWTYSGGSPGGVGYERSSGYESFIGTDVGDQMYGVNGSCYIRIPFTFSGDKASFDGMTLNAQYDDGFIVYLNGVEIARRNFTGEPAWDSLASASHDDTAALGFEAIDVSNFLYLLKTGTNLLSIHALNVSLTSSDFLLAAELAVTRLPETELKVDALRYSEPIPLTKSVKVKARALVGNRWSALSEAVFSVGPVAESLRISEIMYHPSDTGNPDDPNTEFVELVNVGDTTISLNLVRFTDGIDFAFPDVELAPGARCLLARDIAAIKARYGSRLSVLGQYAGNLNNAGERIELVDAAGGVIQSFTYRDDWYRLTDGGGFSLTACDPAGTSADGWNAKEAWRPSAAVEGTPGFSDGGLLVQPGAVVINELLANSSGGIPDWIELHNTTDETIEIGGWFVSDDVKALTKYEIAPGTAIGPHGYAIFTDETHFGDGDDPGCHEPFGLSRDGETVYLHSGSGGALTGYSEWQEFGASEPGVSLGRYLADSGGACYFVPLTAPTPGSANASPRVGPIVISEIMYHPSGHADAEYIELLNIGDADVTLYDFERDAPWRLSDNPDAPTIELLFGAEYPITLTPGQYFLIVKDWSVFKNEHVGRLPSLVMEWRTGSLSDAGATVTLSRPGELDDDGQRRWYSVDAVAYSDGSHPDAFDGAADPWPAEADGQGLSLTRLDARRYGDDPANWQATDPSPGTLKSRSTP